MIAARVNDNYKEITKVFAGGAVQQEVIKIWSTDANDWVYEATDEISGTLPLTFHANGSTLADYRVYGASGGVGDRASIVSDYINGAILYPDGNGKIESYNAMNLALCEVVQGQTYTVARFTAQTQIVVGFFSIKPVVGDTTYDGQVYIKTPAAAEYTFVAPISGYATINSSAVVAPKRNIAVVKGSTAPAEYVPYGYKLPMSVSDGTTSTTTPIYIGDEPLSEDEYVDYGEGKIYRRPNLYDANATDTSKGYLSKTYLQGNTIGDSMNWFVSEYMPIAAGTDYIASGMVDVGALSIIATINIYNSNKRLERYETINSSGDTEINSGVNGAFIRISARNEHKNTVVVKSKNATPTDPPVPLPALPTVDGTNIVDYAGSGTAPEKVYLKYKKGW